jgi:hypothetical protein
MTAVEGMREEGLGLPHHTRLVTARNNTVVIICIVERNDLATWRVSPKLSHFRAILPLA